MQRFRLPNYRSPVSSQSLARWGARLVLLALVFVAIGLLIGFVRMTWTEHKLNQDSAQQLAVNQLQEQRNAALKGDAEYRESDSYVEQAAREQLGMARDGETVLLPTVVLPAPSAPAPDASAAPVAPAVVETELGGPAPNYARWWRALFPGADARP